MRVVVIGAGLAGITTAWELSHRGHEVTVLEAKEGVARETSFANGALLTSSMADPWNAPGVHRILAASLFSATSPMKLRMRAIPSLLTWGWRFLRNSSHARYRAATIASFRLAHYSLGKTSELREGLGLHYEALTGGTIKLFRSRKAMAHALSLAQLLKPLGLNFSVLDPNGLRALEPALAPIEHTLAGGLYFPDDQGGDPLKFCEALCHQMKRHGAVVHFHSRVTGFALNNGKIRAVRTQDAEYAADVVVLAAGVMTGALLRHFGMSLPIQPAKGYTVTFDISQMQGRPVLPIVDDELHAAVVPIGERLRIAGTAEFAGMDKSLPAARIDNLLNLLGAIYPDIAAQVHGVQLEAWAGLRPMSADGLPFIGQTRIAGLFVNAGHGHLGWTSAVGSAHLVSDLIAKHSPAIDPEPYRVTR
jgi:D-amino-acid dehydrogenase